MARARDVPFELTIRCSACGREHVVIGIAELLRQAISFGGPEVQASTAAWAGPATCPREERPFECELLIPANYNESVRKVHITSVADITSDSGNIPAEPAEDHAARDWIDDELMDWRKNTIATQRSYATIMLTTSSGAVGVYFAIVKYLGWEKVDPSAAFVVLTLAPAVLLLLAAATFALALRPSLTFVERSEYAVFRARRVEQMHRRASIGTTLYASALLLAVLTFGIVLESLR